MPTETLVSTGIRILSERRNPVFAGTQTEYDVGASLQKCSRSRQGDRYVKALSRLYSQPFWFEIGCLTSPSERPGLLILGWRDFIGRLVFVFSFLGFLTLVFLSMTGR